MNPQDLDGYDPSETWMNYGDMSPRVHGGRFIRWEGDMWHMIETRDLQEVGPQGMIRDGERYMFVHHWLEPADVWVNGDPEAGLTDEMKSILDSLDRSNYDPDEYPDEMVESDENAGYAPEFLENIEYYVVDLPFHIGTGNDDKYSADYWGYLDGFDIEEEEFADD